MSVESDVATLKKQVVNYLTREQIEALIAALGTDHTTLIATLNDMSAEIVLLRQQVQSLTDELADHETRIAALEP